MRYKKTIDGITDAESTTCIKMIEGDGQEWVVPVDEKNTHYQEYLTWAAEGNTIEESS
jgi:hypothetical protein|tara:strand:+ start:315 stop:488 length:174 start_codon:yes stop_codon:yes gene_type:complete